jgi:hypothetical protein
MITPHCRPRPIVFLGLALLFTACGDPNPETTVVVRAAGHELTVERQARLLAEARQLPDESMAVASVAGLWADYVLLAVAVAEDSTFAQLDLSPMVEVIEEQRVMAALHEAVIRERGDVPAAELRRRYGREGRDAEVRVRQILISAPPGTSQARRDSAFRAIRLLRDRIVDGGESFEVLAREHNQDPRSVDQDGDMGFFGRGDMVEPFERVAYALEPGEVGGPVETVYGYHLVRLEERRTPTFEDFARQAQREHRSRVASEYLDRLEKQAEPRLRPNAAGAVQRLIQSPVAAPGASAADTVVQYRDGAVTLLDLWRYLQRQPQEARRLAGADPAAIAEGLIRPVTQQRLIHDEARRRGLDWTEEDREREIASVRQELRGAARQLGFLGTTGGQAEDNVEDLVAAVERILESMIREEREVLRLSLVGRTLRSHYPTDVREDRFPLVVSRVGQLRQP